MALVAINSVTICHKSAYYAVGPPVSDGATTCSSLKLKLATALDIDPLCSCVPPCYAVWNGCVLRALKGAPYSLYLLWLTNQTIDENGRVSKFQFVCRCVWM